MTCQKCGKALLEPGWQSPNPRLRALACEDRHVNFTASDGPIVTLTPQEQAELLRLAQAALFGS